MRLLEFLPLWNRFIDLECISWSNVQFEFFELGLSVLRTIHFNILRKLQKCNPLWFLLSRKRQIKKLQGYIIACFNLKKESTKNFQFNENKNVSIHCDIYDKKARLISFDMKTMKASISAGNHCIHQAIHCIFSNLQD